MIFMKDHLSAPENLGVILNALHDSCGQEDVETIRGGTQVNLKDCGYKAVRKFLRSIDEAVERKDATMKLGGVWSSRMKKGGFHVPHDHPDGALSGVYYVSVGSGADLVIGEMTIKPEPGMLVVFPSWVTHSTTVYEGDSPRVTVAFDVVEK